MIITQFRFNGSVIYPYQVDNNDFYFKIGNNTHKYPYRLIEPIDYHVGNENLIITKNGSVSGENLALNSRLAFDVTGETLEMKQI